MDITFKNDDERWAAVQQRDGEADGQFYYSVRTTGVYCRPSCGARPALRRNVSFHASRAEAEAAGLSQAWAQAVIRPNERSALIVVD
eukprot:gene38937-48081_t